ncbi:MAG: DUF134 domain-containing protein [Bacteroidales bacterium]|nr:DUF134 domain-containing protein [Bacteroidales bacterium]
MPNRIRRRRIAMMPPMEGYKPFGIPMRELESVNLLFEEFEAIRLADYENLTQEEAAEKMHISRPTFTRLYEKARKNIAKAFIEGKAIIIRGGSYITENYWYKCHSCNETMVTLKPAQHCRKCDSDNIIQINKPGNST